MTMSALSLGSWMIRTLFTPSAWSRKRVQDHRKDAHDAVGREFLGGISARLARFGQGVGTWARASALVLVGLVVFSHDASAASVSAWLNLTDTTFYSDSIIKDAVFKSTVAYSNGGFGYYETPNNIQVLKADRLVATLSLTAYNDPRYFYPTFHYANYSFTSTGDYVIRLNFTTHPVSGSSKDIYTESAVSVYQHFTSVRIGGVSAGTTVVGGSVVSLTPTALDQFGLSMPMSSGSAVTLTTGTGGGTIANNQWTVPKARGDYTLNLNVDGKTTSTTVHVEPKAITLANISAVPDYSSYPYRVNLSVMASGGNGPYAYNWGCIDSGAATVTVLPPTTQSPVATVTLIGAMTTTCKFTVYVSDGFATVSNALNPLTVTLTIPPVTIATSSAAVQPDPRRITLSATASGGTSAANLRYAWSTSMAPPGATVGFSTNDTNASGSCTATVDKEGDYVFYITVYDTNSISRDGRMTNKVTVRSPMVVQEPTATLNSDGKTASVSVAVTGALGTPTYTWTATTGPAFVSFAGASASTTATFTKTGDYQISVQVQDVFGGPQTKMVSITVPVMVVQVPTATLNADGKTANVAVTVTSAVGTPTYTWSVTGPASVSFASASAATTATFSKPGDYQISVKVEDYFGEPQTKMVSITVPVMVVSVPTATLSKDGKTADVAVVVTKAMGTPTYTWSATGPAPVTFAGKTAATTATFTKSGDYTISVAVNDDAGVAQTKSVTLTVPVIVSPAFVSPISAIVFPGDSQAFTCSATANQFGAPVPVVWSVSGGGTINATTGVLKSDATATGTATVTATPTDSSIAPGTAKVTYATSGDIKESWSGGFGRSTFEIQLPSRAFGKYKISFNPYTAPDSLDIKQGSRVLATTGGLIGDQIWTNSGQEIEVNGVGGVVVFEILGGSEGTVWDLNVTGSWCGISKIRVTTKAPLDGYVVPLGQTATLVAEGIQPNGKVCTIQPKFSWSKLDLVSTLTPNASDSGQATLVSNVNLIANVYAQAFGLSGSTFITFDNNGGDRKKPTGSQLSDGEGSNGPGKIPKADSADPVRYGDGEMVMYEDDLEAIGPGSLALRRSYSNLTNQVPGELGAAWMTSEQMRIVSNSSYYIVRVGASDQLSFLSTPNGDQYPPVYTTRYRLLRTPVVSGQAGRLVCQDPSGNQMVFYDFNDAVPKAFQGRLLRQYTAANTVIHYGYDANGNLAKVERPTAVPGESEMITYRRHPRMNRMDHAERRHVIGTSDTLVQQVDYGYYEGDTAYEFGDMRTLRSVTVKNKDGLILRRYHYRYYLANEPKGFQGGLKIAIGPRNFERLVQMGFDPLTMDTALLLPGGEKNAYADKCFEYDPESYRTTRQVLHCPDLDGSGEFKYAYKTRPSTFALPGANPGANDWMMKTVETLPDGSQNVVYTNQAANILVKVALSAAGSTKQWVDAYRYNATSWRLFWHITPAALQSPYYNETFTDLLGYVANGTSAFVKSNNGLIEVTKFDDTNHPAYVQYLERQIGSSGIPTMVKSFTYEDRKPTTP